VKGDYTFWLETSKGKQNATMDAALKAIGRFEASTNWRPFRKFMASKRDPFGVDLQRRPTQRTSRWLLPQEPCAPRMRGIIGAELESPADESRSRSVLARDRMRMSAQIHHGCAAGVQSSEARVEQHAIGGAGRATKASDRVMRIERSLLPSQGAVTSMV
jgi:hypothetical protein